MASETQYKLSEIWIYPVKAFGGIRLNATKVLAKGLEDDRRFMLINEFGIAMTQRDNSKLALFKTKIQENTLHVSYEDDAISLPLKPTAGNEVTARVWDDQVSVSEVNSEYSSWFSQKLSTDCKLVFFPEANQRAVNPKYARNDEHVSLADAYPVLIIGQAALNDLNRRLPVPLPMNRFRPNFVFTGGQPFSEDTWNNFSIGTSTFAAVKPCDRCVVPTINQETGVKGSEPTKTLATYRNVSNRIYFGQNLLVLNGTEVKVGDEIIVQDYK